MCLSACLTTEMSRTREVGEVGFLQVGFRWKRSVQEKNEIILSSRRPLTREQVDLVAQGKTFARFCNVVACVHTSRRS